jgi:hypothetical protein
MPAPRRGSIPPEYRKVRKPMPPPERVIPDKRRKIAGREAERDRRREER